MYISKRLFYLWCVYLFFFFFKQKTAYEMLRSLVGSEMCIRDSGVAALPAVALHLRDGHPLHPEFLQGDLHVVELERLDDRGDEFHASTFLAPPPLSAVASSECRGAAGENAPVKLDPSSYAVSAW